MRQATSSCPSIHGFSVSDASLFRMQHGFNSNGAAASLVNTCLSAGPAGDAANPQDPLHRTYYRGCMKTSQTTGTEWRTPPLWGVGLIEDVNGERFLLHDGRARTLAEAILWHGGEAEAAREAFRAMPKEEREALLAFLRSL